jgi:hypothetical protein
VLQHPAAAKRLSHGGVFTMGVVPQRLSGVLIAVALVSLASCSSMASNATATTTSASTTTPPTSTTQPTTAAIATPPPIAFSALPKPPCPAGYDSDGVPGSASDLCVPYVYEPGGTAAHPNGKTACPPGSHLTIGPALCVSDTVPDIEAPVLSRCRTGQLRVSLEGPYVALAGLSAFSAQNYLATFSNVSSVSCSLYGYPKVAVRNPSGRTVTMSTLVMPRAPSVVALAAKGGRAQFRFGGPDWLPTATASCPQLAEAVITPPGDSGALVVRQHFFLCSGGVEAVVPFGWQP